jgi:hypothetical protein
MAEFVRKVPALAVLPLTSVTFAVSKTALLRLITPVLYPSTFFTRSIISSKVLGFRYLKLVAKVSKISKSCESNVPFIDRHWVHRKETSHSPLFTR